MSENNVGKDMTSIVLRQIDNIGIAKDYLLTISNTDISDEIRNTMLELCDKVFSDTIDMNFVHAKMVVQQADKLYLASL